MEVIEGGAGVNHQSRDPIVLIRDHGADAAQEPP